ncbi:hypothetical protein ACIP98_39670 [Streptomyces sp. NPDC088354]|uniref:hypothetical protein n=1 Tax=Streptomyces sp. NPDC088354 TaxID=3365856 RepID=UPI00382903BE
MAAVSLTGCGVIDAQATGRDLTPAGSWKQIGKSAVNSLTGGEGIATAADGSVIKRGLGSIPLAVRREGFNHIGDLDIAENYTFDSYQGPKENSPKMFLVTDGAGKRLEYRHSLDPGELFNNSFDTVSPDGQWMVSGEFGIQRRLQVFPTPVLNKSTLSDGGPLKQAGPINLDVDVQNIQGCDFFSSQRLVCTSDNADKDVLQVDLLRPIDGKPTTGKVTKLFSIPQISKCSGTFEAEAVDYDTESKTLRTGIISPGLCKAVTNIFSFRWVPSE